VPIRYVGEDDPAAAAAAARESDVAVVVAGYTAADEGEYVGSEIFTDPTLLALYPPVEGSGAGRELLNRASSHHVNVVGSEASGGDRASLRLRPVDAQIIRAVAEANPRTVVAVVTAGAVIVEEWRDAVPAVLFAWYSGSEGGRALADVLLGDVDATGRLPFSIPAAEEHLPFFDRNATAIAYDKWFGQRLLDRNGHAAAFPLGFGLSYTTFDIAELAVGEVEGDAFTAAVTVANTGARLGRHVVQLYARPIGAGDDFPTRVLVGFAPVELQPGTAERVTVRGSVRPLQRWTSSGFVPAAATAVIEASTYAGDPAAVAAELNLR
jgi:beta-glucosidase